MTTLLPNGGLTATPLLESEPPLDLGIPESFANPLMEELDRPWAEAQDAKMRAMRQRRDAALAKIDESLLDPESFFKKHPFESAFSDDIEAAKKRVLVHRYLRWENGGRPLPLGADGAEMMRRRVAARRFEGRGAESDEEFLAEITAGATARKNHKDLAADLTAAAIADAAIPTGEGGGFAAWREAAAALPGYDSKMEADYAEAWAERRAEAAARLDEYRDELVQVWRAFKIDGNITAAAFDAWKGLDADQRDDFLEALSLRARALPKDERAKFLANMSKATARMVADFGRAGAESMQGAALAQPTDPMLMLADALTGRGVYEDTEAAREQAAKSFKLQRIFARKVRAIFREDYDPLKSAFGGGDPGFWEGAAYQTPGVVGTSLTFMVPVAGPAFMAASMEGQAFDDLSARLEAAGLSEDQAADYAGGLAPVVMLPQMALEKAQFGLWSRKMPGVSRVLDAMGDRITNRFLRGATKAGVIGTAETAIELGQDALSFAVQDIAAAMNDDLAAAGVEWRAVGGELWESAPEVFVTMFPLALLGAAGGMSREAQAAAWAKSTPLERRALGIREEDSKAMDEAAKRGPSSLVAAVDQAWARRDPESADAKQAVEEVRQQVAAATAAAADAKASSAFPDIVQTRGADGTIQYSVLDGETKEVVGTATDAAGAFRIAEAHSNAFDERRAEKMAVIATMLDAGEEALAMDAEAGTAENRFELGTLMTETLAAAEDPANIDRFGEQAATRERVNGGDGGVTFVALGQHRSELRGQVREWTNRFFRGSSVTTVFHELWHGLWRKQQDAGTISRDEALDFVMAVNEAVKGRTLRRGATRGESTALLPDGIAREEVTDAMIDEALAEIAEMEVLRTRKRDKAAKATRIGSSVVSRNLLALARLAPGATRKFRALIEAARGIFGLSSARALAMRQAIREGRISEAEYEGFLDRMTGRDLQREHDAATAEEQARIVFDESELPAWLRPRGSRTARREEMLTAADAPFSLGRSSVTPTAETRVFQGAEGSPSVIGPASFSIRAFHGTPHKVDRFSLDKIGTGEGAQAYGWGLYFAGDREVAEQYRINLAYDPDKMKINGRQINAEYSRIEKLANTGAPKDWLYQVMDGLERLMTHESPEQVIEYGKEAEWDGQAVSYFRNAKFETFGSLYTVTLKVEDEDLLDWDKPLSEQSEKVKAYFRDSGINAGFINEDGRKLYESAARRAYQNRYGERLDPWDNPFHALQDNGMAASEILLAAGIRGIRYLDGNSRAAGEGSYNYVIFDEADIEITEENGQPVNQSAPPASGAFSLSPASSVTPTAETRVFQGYSLGKINFNPGGGAKVIKIGDTTIDYGVSRDGETAEIILVKTPKQKRGKGSARLALEEFIRQADAQRITIFLNPEPMDKGITKGGLEEFYKSLGFRKNAGKAKDFRSMAAMVRDPQTEISYSLSPASFVESLSMNVTARIKDPKVKAAMFTRMLDRLALLKRDRDELGIAFGKGFRRRAIDDPRTEKSIRREAAVREAIRREELEDEAHAKHGGILHGEDLSKLWNNPTWAAIAKPGDPLHGRLMSFSAALARGENFFDPKRQGDYDGADGVPRVAFGGDLMPDQAAQELYDAGLLKEPTADALWAALKREAAGIGKMKQSMAAAREDVRKARQQAKEEATAWMNDRFNEEAANYSPRQRLLRALATLDAILSVLPPEVRGKVGGHTRLAKLASDEARLKYLNERVAKVEAEVDKWIKADHRKQLADLIEKSKPKKNKPGEAKRGKIGVDAHRVFAWATKYAPLDETQVEAERIAIENERERIADESVPGIVHPDMLELSNRERALDLVGDFENKTPADQAAALSWLRGTYEFGRDEWNAKESERLAEVARLQRVVIDELARQKGVTLPTLEIPKFDNRKINGMTAEEAEPILRDHDTRVRNVLAKHKAALRKALEEGGVGSLAARQQREREEQGKEARTMLEAGTGEFISFVQTIERLLGPGHPLVDRWNAAVGEAQMQKTEAMLEADAAWLKAASEALGNPGKLKVQERLWQMSAEQTVTIEKQIREPGSDLEARISDVPGLLDGTLDPADHGMTADDLPALQEAWDAHQAKVSARLKKDGSPKADATEFLTFKTVGERTTQEVKLTVMQAVTLVLTSRMARYAKNLELHGFTPDVVVSAAKQIGPEGMAMADWLADYYDKNYEPLAAVFRDMFGVDLPKEANYSPFRAERGGVDKDIGGPQETGMVPEGGFRANMLRTRAPSHQLAPALLGAVSVFQGHVAVSEHWRAFAPLVREMKAVLGGLETRHAIEAVHGKALVRALDGWLLAFEQNGLKQRKLSDGVDRLIRGMQGNIAILGLAFRVSTIVKNYLLPAFGSARRIGILPWIRGLVRVATGQVDYSRFRNSRVVQLRERAGYSPELKLAAAKLLSDRPSRRRNSVIWAMEQIAISDARSTALSAAISWDYHYRENAANGMSAEDAATLADAQMTDDVRRTAQPMELAERSLYELSSSEAGRLLFLFATDARKETAIFAEAMRRAWKENGAKGLLTNQEFRNAATAIWLTTGLLNTVISRVLMDAMDGGDDDEWFDEKNWSVTSLLSSTLLGPVGGIPLLRDLVSGFSQGEMTKPLRGIQAAGNLMEAAWEGDIPDKDRALWIERQINKIMVGAGLFHRGAAETAAFSNIIDQAARMIDNATSD